MKRSGSDGIDDVDISAGDCAHFPRIRRGPDPRRDHWITKSQRAGREKGRRARVIGSHQDFKSAALDLFHIAWINKMPGRQNHRTCRKDFRLPCVRKREIESRSAHSVAPESSCNQFPPHGRITIARPVSSIQKISFTESQTPINASSRCAHRGPQDSTLPPARSVE